jgi:predicted membrane protein
VLFSLAIKYALFALLAIGANICLQDLISRLYGGPFELYVCMASGTLGGLVVKYFLDRKYIFYYQTSGLSEEGEKFFLYTLMGVFTTLIFWGSEASFDWMFRTRFMRYLGAVIGLTMGYWIKYQLDKRFVFKRTGPHVTAEKYPWVDE